MFEQTFKNIDDILHKDAGCTSELDYTEQSSWLLFLKYLDALEADRAAEAELEGRRYEYILAEAYRWERWASPKNAEGRLDHNAAVTASRVRPTLRSDAVPTWPASWRSWRLPTRRPPPRKSVRRSSRP
jgi:type I restriction enzyme M protein